jgi:hypothetical protein
MNFLELSIAPNTTRIARDQASEWLDYLYLYTENYLKENFPWSYKNQWPIKAQKRNGGEKTPKFIVNHHTSNLQGNYKPALNRFLSSEKASSHFLIGRKTQELFCLIPPQNLAYHAYKRYFLPISMMRALNIENGWVNEIGIEVAGNGGKTLFSYEQFVNLICLQRYLCAYFPSIKELKSHKFFSPISRAGDPGPFYLLPLIQHAVFNDIDLYTPNYWLEDYRKDPVKFMNNSREIIKEYKIENVDEWFSLRNPTMANKSNLR